MPYIGNQPGTGVRSRFIYTATASQTTFSGADDNSKTLKYADSAYVDVFLNGVCLVPGTDYTASTKTSIVLTQAASLSDTLEVIAYDIASMSDMSASNGGTFQADVTFAAGADIITATAGTDNVRLGSGAGDSIASGGANNVTIGKDAGTAITTAKKATLIGTEAGDALVDGDNNVAIGYQALSADTNGEKSTAVGAFALLAQNQASLGDTNNVAVGYASGTAITTGIRNTLVGDRSGTALTDADKNTAIGGEALAADTLGSKSTAIGRAALKVQNFTSATDSHNTAVGNSAGESVSTGIENTAIGSDALKSNTTGTRNTAVGHTALDGETTGRASTGIGWGALNKQAADTGNTENTAVGYLAGGEITSGIGNSCFGSLAGEYGGASAGIATGNFNTMIGTGSVPSSNSGSSQIVIAAPTSRTNTTGKGNSTGFINAGGGGVYQGNNYSTWSQTSDRRLKKNIVDSSIGLAEINQLKVRNFEYKTKDDLSEIESDGLVEADIIDNSGVQVGAIAQEIQTVLPKCVVEQSTGVLSLNTDNLTWHLVKALQELSTKNDALETRIAALEAG